MREASGGTALTAALSHGARRDVEGRGRMPRLRKGEGECNEVSKWDEMREFRGFLS